MTVTLHLCIIGHVCETPGEGEINFAVQAGVAVPPSYHLDARRRDRPHAPSLIEEMSRAARALATNSEQIADMMRRCFRGAPEIASARKHMAAFAHLADAMPAHLFDLHYDATHGHEQTSAFLARENPAEIAATETCFTRLHEASMWRTRRNPIGAALGEVS